MCDGGGGGGGTEFSGCDELGGNGGDTTGVKGKLSCGDFELGGDVGGTTAGGLEEPLWCDLCFERFGCSEVGGNADGSGGEEVLSWDDGGIGDDVVGGNRVSGGGGNGANWGGDEAKIGGNGGSLGLGKGGIACDCDNVFVD